MAKVIRCKCCKGPADCPEMVSWMVKGKCPYCNKNCAAGKHIPDPTT